MRILSVIHDFLPRHRAGSEIHADRLARGLAARGHSVWLLAAEYDPARRQGQLSWREQEGLPVVEMAVNWDFASFGESWAPRDIGERLEQLLDAIDPDVVQLHNLLNLSLELPRLASDRGIPVAALLHDYTLVCPSGGQRVRPAENHVCSEIEPLRCARCFAESPFASQMAVARISRLAGGKGGGRRLVAPVARALRRVFPRLAQQLASTASELSAPPIEAADVERRLDRVRRLFEEVDLFVAPSASLGEEFLRLGLPSSRLELSDYGFPPLGAVAPCRVGGPLRFGFVGTLAWHKGLHVLLEALRLLPPEGWELQVHGALDTFPDYTARIGRLASGLPVRFAGPFGEGKAAEILSGIDILVVPSLWPENSPLVIHEAFQAGRPVVGARSGGIADLVVDGVSGLLWSPPNSPSALAAILRRTLEEQGLVDRLAVSLPAVKTIEQDVDEWEGRFLRLLAAKGELPS
jgi:glycosyltransferase involved in cell wall biosynthesis